ncbi:hypothetical protein [Mucilaginibacter pocheonensis]|uniref:YtxH-like protein n=1 Tax=Mucilaginibacter pocheonensis TaxID=398050 RepID=A0ABU1TI82_9SPHI|nr:hypothetical protein [Mucilaginibacter pocheonensis]MDR6945088.1 hypothetical protein [Mucilaginibacter pocheonensis]
MKNPFKKEDHTWLWIAASITGALAAGAGIWFYLHGKRVATMTAYHKEHAQDYLNTKRSKKKKKQRTDLHELEDKLGATTKA